MMKFGLVAIALLLSPLAAAPAGAAVCADGVWRAGCAGPHGAAVVRKPYAAPYHPSTTCAAGPYRAGCAGPNGAVVRRPY